MKLNDIEKSKFTPMIQQYIDVKKDYMDAIVFYRIGDFYEMFFEDAYVASKELELTLTGKDAGVEERVPMCGIPFHAYHQYAQKLVENGHKVAIVEQVEDPREAKGIVKRECIKLLTPGTIIEAGLNDKENNYIVAINKSKNLYTLAYSDISTGEIYLTDFQSLDSLINEILILKSKEIVVSDRFNTKQFEQLKNQYQTLISKETKSSIPDDMEYLVKDIELENKEDYLFTVGLLINYALETQKHALSHLKEVNYYTASSYLRLDPFTKRNLELTETLRQNQRNGSLIWILDKCQTAMGSRMMKKWIDRPLIDVNKIEERYDYVDALLKNYVAKEEIKESLKNVYDLERIVGKISCGTANARDLVQLRKSLENIPLLKESILKLNTKTSKDFSDSIDTHEKLYNLLKVSLVDEPPLLIKEGGMIRQGYNKDLDDLKEISTNSKEWILNFEAKEKERTGIKTMHVGYNRVFGYYIEVSKGQVNQIKEEDHYERKQTLANAERYITPELKKYEQIIVGSTEKIERLEYDLFVEIRNITEAFTRSLQKLADNISTIDCLLSFAEVSSKNNYVRPTYSLKHEINIVDGRHPVIETILKDDYIANDVIINKYNTILITGPNMSGKSTYMRMLASIVLMAQIGCFVSAKRAELFIFDQIFTRIGASDDLISGQSTFMVEMLEANYAISKATKNSLILFDELGRGTATFDGMALAQAIIEYVHEKIGCVMLFSTHYHELIELERTLKRLKNVHVEAVEQKGKVIFLHKVKDGGQDKSYGINVAKLAGLPNSLIERSKQILEKLEEKDSKAGVSLDLFNFDSFEEQEENIEEQEAMNLKHDLEILDVDSLSPREALDWIYEKKKQLEK